MAQYRSLAGCALAAKTNIQDECVEDLMRRSLVRTRVLQYLSD